MAESQHPLFLPSFLTREAVASRTKELLNQRPGPVPVSASTSTSTMAKPSLWIRFKNEMIHYWHGTKLLGTEIKISSKLAHRILHGNKLSRREQAQLRRTTGDLLRLIPFSVFVIVPFMEFLLPVALKLFPNMLPSTFEHTSEAVEKKKKLIKMRLEVARFLQQTIEESDNPASSSASPLSSAAAAATARTTTATIKSSASVKELGAYFKKVRTNGTSQASTEELVRVAKLFPNELLLDNLKRPQLQSMCRYMNLNAFGTDAFLRYRMRNQLWTIKKDDRLLMTEGIDSLTLQELYTACQNRGMCIDDAKPERLKSELAQWLELHLTHSIPATLLILSRAFSLNGDTSASPSPASTTATITFPTQTSIPDASTKTPFTTTTTFASSTATESGTTVQSTTETSSTTTTTTPHATLANSPVVQAIEATLSSLPEKVVLQAKIHASKLDDQNQQPATTPEQKLKVLQHQEELIASENALKKKHQRDMEVAAAEAAATATDHRALDSVHGIQEFDSSRTTPLTNKENNNLGQSMHSQTIHTFDSAIQQPPPVVNVHSSTVNQPTTMTTPISQQQGHVHDDNNGTSIDALNDKARLTEQQLIELRAALGIMFSRSSVLEEREKLRDLKRNRQGYKEDLSKVHASETKVTQRLGQRLEQMIKSLDKELLAYDTNISNTLQAFAANEQGELSVKDLAKALRVIQHTPTEDNIKAIIQRLDPNGDGLVLLSHIWELAQQVEHEDGSNYLRLGVLSGLDAPLAVEKKRLGRLNK
ncbi:hypothetical protein BGZ94_000402 [Podila epigama]|nr:hypothetical protein BGZ94_000402 [Podila epigama]